MVDIVSHSYIYRYVYVYMYVYVYVYVYVYTLIYDYCVIHRVLDLDHIDLCNSEGSPKIVQTSLLFCSSGRRTC